MARRTLQYQSHDAARSAGVSAYQEAKLQQPWKVVVKSFGEALGAPFYEWRLVYMTKTHKLSCEQYDDGHWLVMADHVEHDVAVDSESGPRCIRLAKSLRMALEAVFEELRSEARKHVAIADACARALHRIRRGRSRDQ